MSLHHQTADALLNQAEGRLREVGELLDTAMDADPALAGRISHVAHQIWRAQCAIEWERAEKATA